MIIDIVAQKENLISVSDYTTVTPGVITSSPAPKPGFFWTIAHDGTDEYLLFDGITPFRLYEVNLEVSSVSSVYRLEYSSDGIVWNEFTWKTFGGALYKIADRFVVYQLVNVGLPDTEANRNYLTKSQVVGATGCKIMYVSPYQILSFQPEQVFTRLLKFYIAGNFSVFDVLNEKTLIQQSGITSTEVSTVLQNGNYAFTDASGNYLYPRGLVTTQIRLYFSSFTTNYHTPLSVVFGVMSDEVPSDDFTILRLTANNFYSQQFFEIFPFLPDMVNTFMSMLEERPAEVAENVDLITTFEITAVEE